MEHLRDSLNSLDARNVGDDVETRADGNGVAGNLGLTAAAVDKSEGMAPLLALYLDDLCVEADVLEEAELRSVGVEVIAHFLWGDEVGEVPVETMVREGRQVLRRDELARSVSMMWKRWPID